MGIIQQKQLNHWINYFYGYGSWTAPIWFIGYEEPGGDVPEDVAERINYFAETHPEEKASLCDMRSLYQNVSARLDGPRGIKFSTLFDHRFGKNGVLHGGWKNLIAFAHGYRNKKLPDLFDYQKKIFGKVSEKQEALINLYPLPSPHNHAWYYSWVDLPGLTFIRNRAGYEQHVYESRVKGILQNMEIHKPNLVLMYGMSNINTLKESIQQAFPEANFKSMKALKQVTPQYHRADLNRTTVIITTQVPTLRHNRIETGFDWYGFGKSVRLKADQQ